MLLAISISLALAADNPFRVLPGSTQLAPSTQGQASLTITVPPGTFVYKDMTAVTVLEGASLSAGEADLPPAIQKEDPVLGMTRELWDLPVVIQVPITAPAEPGSHELLVSVTYQGCKGSICYMPVTEELALPVSVVAAEEE
jgi:hypothetical protein